jgi:CDP-4-dehydro-6-deoxyglucose reductase
MEYTIRLEPSGRTYKVAEGEKLLTAGLSAHVKMPFGCRQGVCRSCRGKVVSGELDLGHAHSAYLPADQRERGYALLCQASAFSDMVIELEELPELVEPEIAVALTKSVEMVRPDVALVRLRVPLHLNLRFAAGQYIDLLFPDGVRRSYSIANPPRIEGIIDLELHIRHLPGGMFTDQLFVKGVPPRTKLEFEGPLGTFFLRESEKPALFLATGTGYAPIRSILMHHLPRNKNRKMIFYWGARTLSDLYMIDEAKALAAEHPNLTFIPVLSRPLAEDQWEGETGWVQNVAMRDLPDLSGWQVYACGSTKMVDEAQRRFVAERGLPDTEFFADAFTSMADLTGATA